MIKTTKEIWLETEQYLFEHDFIPNEQEKWIPVEEHHEILKEIMARLNYYGCGNHKKLKKYILDEIFGKEK
tara:strand:- start:217 stop:429 length:213 start_codon:yes stop_codon:yes gene_type:complete